MIIRYFLLCNASLDYVSCKGLSNKKILKKLAKKLSPPYSSVSRQLLQRGEPPQRTGFSARQSLMGETTPRCFKSAKPPNALAPQDRAALSLRFVYLDNLFLESL
ncbi:hypothetical protein [Nostoc sp. UHCC 0252]|uniref:hypothetical protein n=1 Tax=Nostoc sp. UHCC 0252 TaxID=3110241 RepID=UPI002B21D690|nr:hypothetical protein [Nostoc sp. UHCC 0252]MEA5599515.1 hypothetical protein [Nostoc sp. UHCC 0252]